MRSKVTVGNKAEAEIVAMVDEQGRIALARRLGFIRVPSGLEIDPDNNMLTAAAVVDAIAMAAGGNGWLWFPSYVVIRTDLSSAQR